MPVTRQQYSPGEELFVTSDVTVRIPGGLIGVPTGTEVTLLTDKGTRLLVSNGRDKFELNKSQVTNDPKLSETLVERARTVHAAQEQYQKQQEAVLQKQQREAVEFLKTHPLATPTPTPAH